LNGVYMKSIREEFGKVLSSLGAKYSDLVVLDADCGSHTKSKVFSQKYPERFFNIGISEQDLVGIAAGLAVCGKIPIVSCYSMFLMRAWEQIRNTIGRANINVKFVVTHAGASPHADGSSHQCFEDLSIMRVIPNMTVIVPADSKSMTLLLEEAICLNGPVYMRLGRDDVYDVYDGDVHIKIGKANTVVDGSDVSIIASGVLVYEALTASQMLRRDGISASVIDLHTIKPIDVNAIVNEARRTGALVTAEEHSVIGGLGSSVAEVVVSSYPVPMEIVGVRDRFGESSLSYRELLLKLGLTASSIYNAARRVLLRRR